MGRASMFPEMMSAIGRSMRRWAAGSMGAVFVEAIVRAFGTVPARAKIPAVPASPCLSLA